MRRPRSATGSTGSGAPFETVLDFLELPPEIACVGGHVCLAEEAISGRQLTFEGYRYRGETHTLGVVAGSRLRHFGLGRRIYQLGLPAARGGHSTTRRGPPIPVTQLHPGEQRWTVCRDLIHHRSTLEVINDLGVRRFDNIDLEVTKRAVERYSCRDDDLSSVCGETRWTMSFARGDWRVQTITHTILTSTPTDFHVHARLDAYEGAQRVHSAN